METLLVANSIVLWVILILNLILTFALIRKVNKGSVNNLSMSPMLQPGDPIPEFEAKTIDGHVITQDDYLGHEVALVFISPTCGPCREEIPTLNSLYAGAKLNGIDLTMVSLGETLATQNMIKELEILPPVIVAPLGESSLSKDYKVSATPSYYLIDMNGKVKHGGALDDTWKDITKLWRAEIPSTANL